MNKKNWAFYIAFLLLVALAFVLRFYRLDERVFHHDEAAVGYFTYKLFKENVYSYNPAFHGPFMYYTTTAIFKELGDSVYSSRVLPAVFGSSMLLLLLPLRKYIGQSGILISGFFITVSPYFLYYSRFYREDIFISFFSLLIFICAVQFVEHYSREMNKLNILIISVYAGIAAVSLASLVALKENAYVMLVLIFAFLVLMFIRERWYAGLTGKIKSFDRRLWFLFAQILFFLIMFLVLVSLFYTGNLFDITGMKSAFMQAVSHWYEMHRIERMAGPFYFYLTLLALYELPVLVFGLLGIAHYGCCEKKKEKILTVFLLYWIILDLMYYIKSIYPDSGKYLPISYVPDSIIIFMPLLVLAILTVLKSRSIFAGFLIYWFLINLVTYSYLQEKVPWLVLNPLLPLVIIASAYLSEILPELNLRSVFKIIAICTIILMMAFFVYSSLQLNYSHYTDPAEPLIQASQPPQKFSSFIDKINEISQQYDGNSTEIQVTDIELETQFLWYLRYFNNIRWRADVNSTFDAPLIAVHDSDGNDSQAIRVGRRLRTDYERIDSARMSWYWFKPSDIRLDYLLYRKMDREPSEYRVTLFYKPKYRGSD